MDSTVYLHVCVAEENRFTKKNLAQTCQITGNDILWSFSITQILHEINFGDSISSKNDVFASLEAVNFVILMNFILQKVQNFIKIKIQRLQIR